MYIIVSLFHECNIKLSVAFNLLYISHTNNIYMQSVLVILYRYYYLPVSLKTSTSYVCQVASGGALFWTALVRLVPFKGGHTHISFAVLDIHDMGTTSTDCSILNRTTAYIMIILKSKITIFFYIIMLIT